MGHGSLRISEKYYIHVTEPHISSGFGRFDVGGIGQGAFRIIVADSYERQCAISSSHIIHILESRKNDLGLSEFLFRNQNRFVRHRRRIFEPALNL